MREIGALIVVIIIQILWWMMCLAVALALGLAWLSRRICGLIRHELND